MTPMPTPAVRPSRREFIHDALLGVGLTVFGWVQVATVTIVLSESPRELPPGLPPFGPRVMEPTWVAFALIALAYLPLAARRRFPLTVLVTTAVAAAAYDLVPNPPGLVFFGPLIALYTVGTLYNRRVLWGATVIALAPSLAVSLSHVSSGRLIAELVRVTALFLLAAAMGDATRTRRAYIAEVEARAAEAERTREEEAARRVQEERLRIARELHDVTAHSLSIIAVQAGAAATIAEKDPAAARSTLETVRHIAKASLDELRSMLGVLRGGEDAPLAPTGTLARLPELARTIEQAGVRVELRVEELGETPAYADVSAYRIVQEALTNVVRHARATTATVTIRREARDLTVEVTDDGAGAPAELPRDGHGIAGMRERAAALGGSFEAGPGESGGFTVRARLPIDTAVT